MNKCYISNSVNTCPGCGLELALRSVMEVMEENTIIVIPPGCAALFSGFGKMTAMKIPGFQGNLENTAAYAAGIRSGLDAQGKTDVNVLAFAGDGATVDIGLQALSGMLERGERVVYICYDNEAYMNTGGQKSGSTPRGAMTTTTPDGKTSMKKNMLSIVAAHKTPYIASASVGYIADLKRKVAKAKCCPGPAYIHIHTPCPTGWGFPFHRTIEVARLAVECGAWELFEIVNGDKVLSKINIDKNKLCDYMAAQKRFSKQI